MLHYVLWTVLLFLMVQGGVGIMRHYARVLSFEIAPAVT